MRQTKINSDPLGKPSSLGAQPAFYLVYLGFYFLPWLFYPPTMRDMLAATIFIAAFVPIYLHATKRNVNAIPHILAMSLIAYAASSFHGSFGVFHIFAMVSAATLRPERKAWIWIISLTLLFGLFCVITQQNIWNYVFALLAAVPIAIGTMYGAEQQERETILQRSREHDQHLATLAERERIAQDLHDLLGQTLTMVALKSELAVKLFDQAPEQAKQELSEIQAASRTALKEVRDAVSNINNTSLNREIKRAQQLLSSAGVKVTIRGVAPELSTELNTSLGLAVREAITNIVRHADATHANITIKTQERSLAITIADNGHSSNIVEGSGLSGLRKRIEKLGGEFEIGQNNGLELSLAVPLRDPQT